jgi:hypothetical protein
MKRNIRKLTVLVVVPVMALFAMGVISSAGSATHVITGRYAATGSSFCWTSLSGFDETGTAIKNYWAGGFAIWEAEYTFNRDGTGTASGDVRATDSPSALAGDFPVIWAGTLYYEFTYEFTDAQHITFTSVPNTFVIVKPSGATYLDLVPNHGVISLDGKTIMISSGPMSVASFMKQDAQGNWVEAGPKQACALSVVLIKLK